VFKYKIRGYENKAKVIYRDFPAANGVIHVVNDLLINDATITGDEKVGQSQGQGDLGNLPACPLFVSRSLYLKKKKETTTNF
jgi:hypothetical protein